MEAVAAARRQLPPGGIVPQDYIFQGQGPGGAPAGTTYSRDYLAEAPNGDQLPMLNVFHRGGDTIRHFWGSELFYAPEEPGQETRHVGTLEPLWNMFDLTPEGRGTDWDEQLSY
jgi:predicted dithiol-disulfide oxidoreductase (DUF899 family)